MAVASAAIYFRLHNLAAMLFNPLESNQLVKEKELRKHALYIKILLFKLKPRNRGNSLYCIHCKGSLVTGLARMEISLPPGFRFNPTDQELIWHYLYKKVNGIPLSSNAVFDCDIYGGDDSWRKMFDDREEECLYFFTKLRNRSTKSKGPGSKAVRTTKSDTWKCQSDMEIHAGKKHIGSKRTLSFIEKKKKEESKIKGSKKANGWTMHEYRLDGCLVDQKEAAGSSDYGYVLSRINRPRHFRRHERESITIDVKELNQDSDVVGMSVDSF